MVGWLSAEVLPRREIDIRTRCQVPARLGCAHRGAGSGLLRLHRAAPSPPILRLQRRIRDSCGGSRVHDLCEFTVAIPAGSNQLVSEHLGHLSKHGMLVLFCTL